MSAHREEHLRAGRNAARPGADVRRELADGGPTAWIAFDQEVRSRLRYGRDDSAGPREGLHATLLCHPDGRIREAALDRAERWPELVAIRCADWAPAVRDRARQVLGALLRTDPERAARTLTPLVLRLSAREQGGWALARLEEVLRDDEPVLAALRADTDLPTRRYAARLTLESGRFDARALARLAAIDPDPVTARLWADAATRLMATDGPDDEAVDLLLGARSPMVRATGVTALRGAGRTEEAVRHLADRSGLVRACARWLVGQGGGDPFPHYLELVTDPGRVTAYAVAGFAECARRTDGPRLHALLTHPDGRVRAAAVAGLRLLDDNTDITALTALLEDPWPAVVREASRSLLPFSGRLDADRLVARLAADRPRHLRRAAFRLLRARRGTTELRACVAMVADDDPRLRATARATVRGWKWQLSLHTDDTDRPELAELLRRSAGLFDAYEMGVRRSRLGLTR
ncbi:HEAT repeat domain-containing protein [Streptomyces sp. NPDC060010]|uniref:HEAT repeat domain-containing protein n=1 Tax=Streptomyces sp. NPDC060010 TaxID=3347036 RepID=UPI00369D5D6C